METKTTGTDTGKHTMAVNNLIKINNDRYEGYKTAADETKDSDLKTLFMKHGVQSKGFAEELRKFVPESKAPDHDETTAAGKAYRVWMDLKAAITGKDRKGILSACEFGEDAAQKAYEEALKDSHEIPQEVSALIQKQRTELKAGHDRIKAMRDSAN